MTVELKGYYKIYHLSLFSLLFVIGIIATIRAFENNTSIFMKGFLIIWLVFTSVYIYRQLHMVVKLEIAAGNKVIFTLFTGRSYVMTTADIISVTRRNTFADIRTRSKKFITIGNHTVFRDYVYMIKSSNPELKIIGY
jgi:hypothetical protein